MNTYSMSYLKNLALIASASMLLAACSDDNPWVGQDGAGALKLHLAADSNVTDAIPQTRVSQSIETPDVNLFAIKLEKADGTFSKTWPSVADFNSTENFKTGAYTISAAFGDVEKEGFDSPAFYGEAAVMVLEGETTQSSVTATLANTMVSIDFTDAFKTFFPQYAAQVHSEGHSYVDIMKEDAGRPAFLAPGNVDIAVTLTQPNTGKTTTIQPAEFEAKARHHYHVTLDYNNGGVGEGQFVIRFDDSVVEEDVIIDLTDELFTAPEPKVTPAGFTSGEEIEILQGSAYQNPLKFNVNAAGKIKEANLTVQSEGKAFADGSKEINLVTASDADQATIASWGLNCKGFFRVPDRFAFIDLDNFIKKLPAGKHTVSLQVKDVMTHVSEPVSITVNVAPVEINVSPQNAIFGGDELILNVAYNGEDLENNISFKVLNNSGNYVDAPIVSCLPATRAVESKNYTLTVRIPVIDRTSGSVRTYFQGVQKSENTFQVVMPKYEVQVDAFATYADVKIIPEDPSLTAAVTSAARLFFISDNDGTPQLQRNTSTGVIRALNLTPATAYTLNTTLDKSLKPQYATSTPFSTETIAQIPNGDFSRILENSLSISGLQVGGKYKVGFSYHHTSSIQLSEPEGWANINSLTAYKDASPKNTWFIVPSTYSSDGAVTIRSVGYNHSGKEPEASSGAIIYYCQNAPAESDFVKAAGQLFLGSYSFNGSESRSDGIAFSSRPSSLSFDYKYQALNGEEGYAEIKLLDSSNAVISQKSVTLPASSDMKTLTVALPGYAFGKKASKIIILFKSSTADSPAINIPKGSALNENQGLGNKTIAANRYHALATGSVLTVDNVALGYDASVKSAKPARKSNSKKYRK